MFARRLLFLVLAALLLFLGLLPGSASAPAAWQATSGGNPVALCAASAPLIPPVAGGRGTTLAPLPSSVLPHTDLLCSIQAGEPPAFCSTDAGSAGNRCSAYTDESMRCSAFDSSGSAQGAPACSVNRQSARCSVLLPTVNLTGASECSVFVAEDSVGTCSTIGLAPSREYCSAANGGARVFRDLCSTLESNLLSERNFCSVENGATGNQHYCSTGSPGNSLCSTFAMRTGCSVRQSMPGACTSFRGAPAGTCSTFAPQTRCSVIFGSTGNRCVVP